MGSAPSRGLPHISVCICTFKRPDRIGPLLAKLDRQLTDGLFTYSIVVSDNDAGRSAEGAVCGNERRAAGD